VLNLYFYSTDQRDFISGCLFNVAYDRCSTGADVLSCYGDCTALRSTNSWTWYVSLLYTTSTTHAFCRDCDYRKC